MLVGGCVFFRIVTILEQLQNYLFFRNICSKGLEVNFFSLQRTRIEDREDAGGQITDFTGKSLDPRKGSSVVGTNGYVHAELLKILLNG